MRLYINILPRNSEPQDNHVTLLPEGPGGASPGRTGTRRRIEMSRRSVTAVVGEAEHSAERIGTYMGPKQTLQTN